MSKSCIKYLSYPTLIKTSNKQMSQNVPLRVWWFVKLKHILDSDELMTFPPAPHTGQTLHLYQF